MLSHHQFDTDGEVASVRFAVCFKQSKYRAIHSNIVAKMSSPCAPLKLMVLFFSLVFDASMRSHCSQTPNENMWKIVVCAGEFPLVSFIWITMLGFFFTLFSCFTQCCFLFADDGTLRSILCYFS